MADPRYLPKTSRVLARKMKERRVETARGVLDVALISIVRDIVSDSSLDHSTRLRLVQQVTGYESIPALVASRELREMSQTSRTPYLAAAADAFFKFASVVEQEA